jgi:hypothetical protein
MEKEAFNKAQDNLLAQRNIQWFLSAIEDFQSKAGDSIKSMQIYKKDRFQITLDFQFSDEIDISGIAVKHLMNMSNELKEKAESLKEQLETEFKAI